jgi:ankyrin repeat protein
MGGFSMIILAVLGIISLTGLALSIAGFVLLIVFLIKRKKKTKAKNVLLVLAILFLVLGIPTTCVLPGFLIIGNNAAINSSINSKQYPVTNAIAHHDNNKLENLLKNGGNPNEIYSDMPAIFSACNYEYKANSTAVKLLISYHADINAAYNFSSFDAYHNPNTLMKYIFISTIASGNESELLKIEDILLQNGYDANETDSVGATLLMYATSTSAYFTSRDNFNFATNSVILLINHGANINATDKKGRTPLMWACGSGNPDDFASEIEMPKTIETKDGGFAPFDYRVIKYLVDNGADVNAKDKEGYTALDYFKQSEEYAKCWYDYNTVGKSQDYIDECKNIESLLQIK